MEERQEQIMVREAGGQILLLGTTFSLSINKQALLQAMGYHICARCGMPYDIHESGDPNLCKKCKAS